MVINPENNDQDYEFSDEQMRDLISQLTAERDALKECLKTLMLGFESGVWVRNTTMDHERDWAIKLVPHIKNLVTAATLIDIRNETLNEAYDEFLRAAQKENQ